MSFNLFKSTLLIFSVFSLVIFTSCKDQKTDKKAEEATQSQTTEQTKTNAVNNNTAVTINPAHGQPGHRCDIKVGDPIPNASSVINNSKQSPVINNTGSVPVNNNSSTAKVNPAHGQPGHRCDIPVGAAL